LRVKCADIPQTTRPVKKEGDILACTVAAGETVEFTFERV